MNRTRVKVWDLPTRLFHWVLALAVASAVATGYIGGSLIEWHGRIGMLIIGLLSFRIAWGVAGSTYARFAQFMPTPSRLKEYLGGGQHGEGHNPLGALSVIALIALLLAQALSGLAANDDIAFTGPLYSIAGSELSATLTGMHYLLANIVLGMTGLHLGAIVFYAVVKKKNLVKPMITGWKEDSHAESARGGGAMALVVALLVAVLAVFGASGVWISAPPPASSAGTPDW